MGGYTQSQFDQFLAEEVNKYKGIYAPERAGALRRLLIRKTAPQNLHPNPGDEFTMPDIGPSYEIISRYEKHYLELLGQSYKPPFDRDDPLMVEKIRPDGYMLLNGHHRWAAALRAGLKCVPIKIVNLTQELDIRNMLQQSKHERRVTLDLDEVVFCRADSGLAEKGLSFPFNRMYKERLSLGIPALFHFLNTYRYDIWVYSAQFYSHEYIRNYFRHYNLRVCGIITGTGRRNRSFLKNLEKQMASKYTSTIHIDHNTVLRTFRDRKEFDEQELNCSPAEWSEKVREIISGWQ